ncbi:MAG: hypothetical protein VKL59_10545 [Nostocaceae cyanobacterium]|nr:hypothetical protein [Nostocaceae cyanobacterium]
MGVEKISLDIAPSYKATNNKYDLRKQTLKVLVFPSGNSGIIPT